MRMSNEVYDALKVVQKVLILIATFYTTLAQIWGLPYGEQISKTCLALATLLLGILEISSLTYKNDLLAQANEGEPIGEYVPNADVVEHEMDEGEG